MKVVIAFAFLLCIWGWANGVPHAEESGKNEYYEALGIEPQARTCIEFNEKCDEHGGDWCCNWGINGCGCSYSYDGKNTVSHCRCMSRWAVALAEALIPAIKRE